MMRFGELEQVLDMNGFTWARQDAGKSSKVYICNYNTPISRVIPFLYMSEANGVPRSGPSGYFINAPGPWTLLQMLNGRVTILSTR